MTTDRLGALEMIEKFKKEPHPATKADINWFWQDLDSDDKESYREAKKILEDDTELRRLHTQYPFELTEWLMEWYSYMPECLYYGWDRAGQVDWNLFFTLIEPIKTSGLPFISIIKALNVRQNQIAREQIYNTVFNDPILRKNALEGGMIPTMFTHYTTNSKIRNEVLKRLKGEKIKDEYIAPIGSRKIFKKADKLVKSGLSLKEALEISDREFIQSET